MIRSNRTAPFGNNATTVGLGLDYPEKFNHLYEEYQIYNTAEIFKSASHLLPQILSFYIDSSDQCTFFMYKHSVFKDILNPEIILKINLIDDYSTFYDFEDKRKFLICDPDEYRKIKESKEFKSARTIGRTNLINVGKMLVLTNIAQEIIELTKILVSIKSLFSKDNALLPICKRDRILSELIFPLSKKFTYVLTTYRRNFSPSFVDIPCNLAEIDLQYVLRHENNLTLICPSKDMLTPSPYRFIDALNSNFNKIFIYGQSSKCKSATTGFKPFILWAYPGAGTTRFQNSFKTVMNMLNVVEVYPVHYVADEATLPFIDKEKKIGLASSLFPFMTLNSYLKIHSFDHDFSFFLQNEDAHCVLLTRDMRDIIISSMHWQYNTHRMNKGQFEETLLQVMKGEIINLRKTTHDIVDLINVKKVSIIKFEDIDISPYKAYRNLFTELGVNSHPMYNNSVDNALKQQIDAALPANCKIQGFIRKGAAGDWKNHFNTKHKDYFKKNSNNILQILGYEKDDSW